MKDKNNNTGNWNSGSRNSGDQNSGDWNSGDWNSGDQNSGNWNSGDWNSGNRNSGDWNSGSRNSGDWNSGDQNSGDWNSGDQNSGNWNSGDWNSGDQNSGYGNSTKRETGIFNTTAGKIRCFNLPTDLTWDEIEHPSFMEFHLNRWIDEKDMTEQEKIDSPEFHVRGGYLKTFEWEEAWANYWRDSDEEEKKKVLGLPNFDPVIFKEITGIDVEDQTSARKKEILKKIEELKKEAEGL
jgi:hypothetical protein